MNTNKTYIQQDLINYVKLRKEGKTREEAEEILNQVLRLKRLVK